MRGKARRLSLEHGLDLLIVDYLQLIQGGSQGGNRVQEISEISRSLKGMARDLGIALLTCSQLSRVVENRPGHRPQLSDLRDSGSIEQDADSCNVHPTGKMSISPKEEWEQQFPGRPYPRNIAEVILAKHRNGPTGGVKLFFRDNIVRFDSIPAVGLLLAVNASFSGFGRNTGHTSVPNPMLGTLLEEIQDVAELKVALRGIWLLRRKRGWPRWVEREEFLSDYTLLRGLADCPGGAQAAIGRGLDLATQRGIFLAHRPAGIPGASIHYLLNTDADRRALDKLEADGSGSAASGPEDAARPLGRPDAERPNIYVLYEDNVGMISPIVADELREAEDLYPGEWLTEAFRIASVRNRRSWGYISGILRRWASEGKNANCRNDSGGREDGATGRYPQENDRQKFLKDYQWRWGETSRRAARK